MAATRRASSALALALFALPVRATASPIGRFCAARGATPATSPAGARSRRPDRRLQGARAALLPGRAHPPRLPHQRHLDRARAASSTSTRSRSTRPRSLPSFERGVLPDLAAGERAPIAGARAVARARSPDSSLSHMFGVVLAARRRRAAASSCASGELASRRCSRALDAQSRDAEPSLLCGTAFAFVHLLDALERAGPAPRAARRLAHHGDGRLQGPLARAAARASSRRARGARSASRPQRIVNQYGMTRARQPVLRLGAASSPRAPRRKLAPPWTRVRLVDPASGRGRPQRRGRRRSAIVDLANTGSVLAIQTADLGRALRRRLRGARAASRAPRRAAARSPRTRCSAPERRARRRTRAAARRASRLRSRAFGARACHDALADVLDAWSAADSRWQQAARAGSFRPRRASRPHGAARDSRAVSRATTARPSARLCAPKLGGPERLDTAPRRPHRRLRDDGGDSRRRDPAAELRRGARAARAAIARAREALCTRPGDGAALRALARRARSAARRLRRDRRLPRATTPRRSPRCAGRRASSRPAPTRP